MKIATTILISLGLMAATSMAVARTAPAYITAALSDPGRTDSDRQSDTDRKPAEMVEFAGIKPGMKVVDLMPGGGYFTRIFAKVVGDKGYVYAYVPSELDPFLVKRFGSADAVLKLFQAYPNASVLHAPLMKFVAPEKVDLVWTSRNYHDFHDTFMGPADLAVVNKAIFDALKPGGIYLILDHAAAPGSGLRDTETLHRIDEAAVKKEVEAAGFKLVAESNALRSDKDDHTAKIFDAAVKGKTDQFILKFRKPMK